MMGAWPGDGARWAGARKDTSMGEPNEKMYRATEGEPEVAGHFIRT